METGEAEVKRGSRCGIPNLNQDERRKIHECTRSGMSCCAIARRLNRSPSTIQKEVARGKCEQLVNGRTLKTKMLYDWYHAQMIATEKASNKGGVRKLNPGDASIRAITAYIKKGYSPYAAIIKATQDKTLKVKICVGTVYAYVHSGAYGVCDDNLLRPRIKRKKKDSKKYIARSCPIELSIENRPKKVYRRKEFGHWEGDLVCSPTSCGNSAALFTLVERKTRFLITTLIPDKTQDAVQAALDRIELYFGDSFKTGFKTITFDNGIEFTNPDKITRSIHPRAPARVSVYYAHPYSSSERGTNENTNGFLRRYFPKGTAFCKVDKLDVASRAKFINNYPRKILKGNSAAALFERELRRAVKVRVKASVHHTTQVA